MGKDFRLLWFAIPFVATVLASNSFAKGDEASPYKLAPAEAVVPSSLVQFLATLRTVVTQRDTLALQKLFADDAVVSKGPVFGQSLVDTLQLNNPASPAWHDLEVLLELQGRFVKSTETLFCKPYIHQALPEWALESPSYKVVIQPGAKLRSTPSMDALAVRDVAYEIVALEPMQQETAELPANWSKVKAQDEIIGYIPSSYLWGAYDPVVCFSECSGRWVIEMFISSLD